VELERASQAISDPEELAAIRTGLAIIYAIRHDFEQALHHHRAARTLSRGIGPLANMAVTLGRMEKYDEELKLWFEVLEMPNGYTAGHLAAASLCASNLGLCEEAEQLYREAVPALTVSDEYGCREAASAACALGHEDEGLEILARWVAVETKTKLGEKSAVEFLDSARSALDWPAIMTRTSPGIVRAFELRRHMNGSMNWLPPVAEPIGPRDLEAESNLEDEALKATSSWRALANATDLDDRAPVPPTEGGDA